MRVLAAGCAAWACWLSVANDVIGGYPMPGEVMVSIGEIIPVVLRPGEVDTAVVTVVVAAGFHVQANPAGNEFLVPLELSLEGPENILTWHPVYPPPATLRLQGTTEDLLTYHDSIAVRVVFKANRNAQKGEWQCPGSVRYQACDSTRCYFPASVHVTVRVRIH